MILRGMLKCIDSLEKQLPALS